MKESVPHLQKRLKKEGTKIASFFLELSDTDWELVVYNDGPKWTLLHLMKHFVSVEQAFQWIIQDVLEGGTGTPENFVIDEFNKAEVGRFSEYKSDEIISAFQALRKDSIALAGALTSDDLEKTGNHPYFGKTKLKRLLKFLYTHNNMHMRDVRRVMGE
jgi:hypothetical protein